jgi:hypothetical protein
MPKRATPIVLSEKEQEGLLQITKRHRSEQQVVMRARIVLAAAQGHTNVQIASELDINVDTVRLWSDRWAGLQGIEPCDLELGRAVAGCSPPWNEAKVYCRPTLSDGSPGMFRSRQSGVADQLVDGAGEGFRAEGARHRRADFTTACRPPAQKRVVLQKI